MTDGQTDAGKQTHRGAGDAKRPGVGVSGRPVNRQRPGAVLLVFICKDAQLSSGLTQYSPITVVVDRTASLSGIRVTRLKPLPSSSLRLGLFVTPVGGGTAPVPVSQAPGVNPLTQCAARLHGSPKDAALVRVWSLLIEGHPPPSSPKIPIVGRM